MKTIILVLLLWANTLVAQQGFFSTPDYDEFRVGVWWDPVAQWGDGVSQFGIDGGWILRWGWVSASVSTASLSPTYTDAVGMGGVNWHMFHYNKIRYYIGPRLGFMWRGEVFYPLAGGIMGVEWMLNDWLAIGARYYIDYREDQEADHFGDYDAYEPGFLTNNPLLQENGAVILTFRL